ncbi:hypothetical protein B0T18DRAFT_27579 [Schizothecium vesticola]|uniref:Uncharacterized protein n=1 Tax=Schizothecium vesticola TaxID=314040 RepID=A0AA40KCR8_9PEZI|nr:hypothetical protein B0T18DRAFT_27579 [Schizothecium vesticola]
MSCPSCNPQSRSRNPQPAIHSHLSHSWRGNHSAAATISSRRPASVLRFSLSPPRRASVGHVLPFPRLIPPPSQNRPQSHHSIPSIHPPTHPIHPFIPSRPRLSSEALLSRRRHFAANTSACVRLTTTSRQDERFSLASRAASTTSTVARLHRHRRRERSTWLGPTTARPTRNSRRDIGAYCRRLSPRRPRRRHRQWQSDASLRLPASTGITTGACRWLDRCAQWSPLPLVNNIPSRHGCSTMIELRQPSDVDTSPSTVSPVPSR